MGGGGMTHSGQRVLAYSLRNSALCCRYMGPTPVTAGRSHQARIHRPQFLNQASYIRPFRACYSQTRVAINPKSQVVRRGEKRWKKVLHTAKRLPYEVGKRWPGEATGGLRPVRQ